MPVHTNETKITIGGDPNLVATCWFSRIQRHCLRPAALNACGTWSAIDRHAEHALPQAVTPANLPTRSRSLNSSFAVWKRSSGRLASRRITVPWNISGIAIWNFFGFSGS